MEKKDPNPTPAKERTEDQREAVEFPRDGRDQNAKKDPPLHGKTDSGPEGEQSR